ncbi:MAG TPA: ROK family protein [Candidatus Borkfalkia stercoripullorum]|nr:ROK family protein [Candidatus Borkfalkia stercoripullorum]
MYIAGMDIGGTKCASILAEVTKESVRFLNRTEFPTGGGWKNVLERLAADLEKNAEKAGIPISDLAAVGISCGGPLDAERGLILSPPNLPGWDEVPVCAFFRSRWGIPARLMNDADACAVAEWKYGAGRGLSHVIFLTFGTGMGAGLILNGKLYEGACSSAGEIGHVRIGGDGPVGYGKRGSFEGYCSGSGIARLARILSEERAQSGKPYPIGGKENPSAKEIAEAARGGNEDAAEVYREAGRRLGTGLSILVDVLNPQMIVMGGVFMRSHDLLEDEMLRVMQRECLPHALEAVRIVPSELGERIGDYGAVVAGLDVAE